MSLPEVLVGHFCKDCSEYVPEMMRDIKRPCVHRKRVSKGGFCVPFKPKSDSGKET